MFKKFASRKERKFFKFSNLRLVQAPPFIYWHLFHEKRVTRDVCKCEANKSIILQQSLISHVTSCQAKRKPWMTLYKIALLSQVVNCIGRYYYYCIQLYSTIHSINKTQAQHFDCTKKRTVVCYWCHFLMSSIMMAKQKHYSTFFPQKALNFEEHCEQAEGTAHVSASFQNWEQLP